MLDKLIKYEFKASSRIFLLLYGALLLLTLINGALIYIGGGFNEGNPVMATIQSILLTGYVIMIVATFIVTAVVIILRFYRNLMGDDGYLMFTLPVSTDSQILSKLTVSLLWSILSAIIIILSLFIVTAKYDTFKLITEFIDQLSSLGLNIPLWILGIVFSVILYFVAFILMFYAAIAIGSNLTKNRLLGSFLGYIILYLVSQGVGLISVAVIYFTGLMEKFESLENEVYSLTGQIDFINGIGSSIFLLVNILNILLCLIYYFVTRYFIKNKLNLS